VSGLLGARAKTKLVVYLSVVLWLALAGLLLAAAPARADLVAPPNRNPSPRVLPHRHLEDGRDSSNGVGTVVTWVGAGLAVVLLAAGSWLALRKMAASHAAQDAAAQRPASDSSQPGEDEH
jgi:hypothetical protein